MTETILRQGQAWRGNRASVGIADQGQNRVLKRGGGNLDPALLRGIGVCGENFADQVTLALDHELLVLERIAAGLTNKFGNFRLLQEELIEPCDLREHLQISKVLGLKISFGALRRRAATLKPV